MLTELQGTSSPYLIIDEQTCLKGCHFGENVKLTQTFG